MNEEMMDFIKAVAEEAGRLSLERTKDLADGPIGFKMEKDLVTDADREVEELIIGRIRERYPDHGVLGEETGRSGGGEYLWIIDPIDGTTSYVHDQPYYSISIAVKKGAELIAGCIRAPKLNETYWAELGGGAYRDGERVGVSKRDSLISSVLSTGFACLRADLPDNNLPYFNRIAPKIRGIRRYGSAAIDLAYVACGRLEGFWEMNLKIYDAAAGILLVREGGGKVCDFKGGDDYPDEGLVATNGLIEKELLENFR